MLQKVLCTAPTARDLTGSHRSDQSHGQGKRRMEAPYANNRDREQGKNCSGKLMGNEEPLHLLNTGAYLVPV